MTDSKLNYVGPIPRTLAFERGRPAWWRRIPVAGLLIVGLPTLLAAIYFLLIASPRYVSEARFLVRSAGQSAPTSLGVALQGVGIAPTQTDAFAVHEYVTSRDGLAALSRRYDIWNILAPPGADAFSRFPRPWEGRSNEALYKGFQRYITVGYDSATGISTLRVEAFRPRDAQALTEALLSSSEDLVNRMNERSSADAVSDALRSRDEARQRLSLAQQELTAFRNREQFLDPTAAAAEGNELIGGLLAQVATLRADRAQLASEAPSSPQLPIFDSRIAAYTAQIASERAKLAGAAGSLAPKISIYEDLSLNREFADRELTQATAAVVTAEQEARRQKLYLDRIVNPSLPDEASEPKRWLSILTVFASMVLIYGVGWLVYAGVREHRQD
ncbi:chain-length determining protein [Brevundimonas sp.]|uniref:chain-length determining protein n=1 Tax=Brevundimonas sp. TaxID=1871086 RepID=UPI001A328A88|nr:chain-length determining protein [Brevundimonas sp.]MBJ7485251.1 chain-length determining protein [Brevundimonas sp.]